MNDYRGDLLDGMYPEGVAPEFQEWLDAQRRTIRELAARAAWETSRAEESRGDRGAAVAMAGEHASWTRIMRKSSAV